MRIVRFAAAALGLALLLNCGMARAQDAGTPVPAGDAGAQAATTAAPAALSTRILISGIPAQDGATGTPADVQAIVDAAYQKAIADAGHPAALDDAQMQAAAEAITGALRQAGYAQAHAWLPGQLVEVSVTAAAPAPVAAAPAVAAPAPAPAVPGDVVPPVRDRGTAPAQTIAVSGFKVEGVGDHPDLEVTPASIQALADAQYRKLAAAGSPAQLTFEQMQGVADTITERYRSAGFIVANAFLPAQTVGDDGVVRISVLEGKIGKVIVKGTKHYRPGVVAAPAEGLKGKPLLNSEVDTALLYAADLPGIGVSSTFQPGEHTGETDLVMVANERRPVEFTLGANNYGTELTGRYRAQAGLTWNSPLGIGDKFVANVDYALDPSNNVYGALAYSIPTVAVPGLGFVVGATRDELQINTGTFAALDVKGPSKSYYAGADWKFVNDKDLWMQGGLHYIREQSQLSSLGMMLSNEKFDVAELKFNLSHTDRRLQGLDLFEFALRQSIRDNSLQPDLVAPMHARNFLVARLAYTRMQFLDKSQRLYFKFAGQYTRDALVPLEQFSMGGPDSVRAYPIAEGLRDRGYYTSLEYHVDAPGFGDVTSPFYGRPWRELLEFEAFLDYARGFSAGANRGGGNGVTEFKGAGLGLIFRLPQFKHFEFRLDGAVPVDSPEASDKHGYHIYSRFSFTF